MSEVYAYTGFDKMLAWQYYEPVRRRGREGWIVLRGFENPWRWAGGQLVLRDAMDFTFSHLWMTEEMSHVCFEIAKLDGGSITAAQHRSLGRAIVDGMEHDYDRDEFRVVLSRGKKALAASLLSARDWDDDEGAPDRDGIVWQ